MSQISGLTLEAHAPRPPIQRPRSGAPPSREQVERQLNKAIAMMAKHTAETREIKFRVAGVDGKRDGEVTIRHTSTQGKDHKCFRSTRATLVRVKGSEWDKLKQLERMDTRDDEVLPTGRMSRKSSRLNDAVAKASTLKDPSFRIYSLQRRTPMGFGGVPSSRDRPLRPHGLVVADQLARHSGTVDEAYKETMIRAIEMGDFTTHDPDTLHPRFLEYVHERIRTVPRKQEMSLVFAKQVMHAIWRRAGVKAVSLTSADTTEEKTRDRIHAGSSGEYCEKGIRSRNHPKMHKLLSRSLERFVVAGKARANGRPVAPWVHFTQQPVMSFGKTELKPAKEVDGERVLPVPRFIFNVSPVNYALASFLHGDLSHQLQELDPTHGPGFGPARARCGKFTDKVRDHLRPDGSYRLTHRAIMSDISKWDANMSEALISVAFDTMEEYVDKSKLSEHDKHMRELMVMVSKRQMLSKIVEHPSGYFVELYGCMPSGSFYTSVLNTVANDLLAISLLGSLLLEKGVRDLSAHVEEASMIAGRSLVSYGDNQLIFESLFTRFGLAYDVQKHADHLRVFGMTLKVDETDVSDKVGRVRFCSRGAVVTPYGLAVTRSHESVFQKIGGRPVEDPVHNKLYVRALMVDLIGTDPSIHAGLCVIDESIAVPSHYRVSGDKVQRIVAPFAKRLFGNDDPRSVEAFAQLLQTAGPPDRRTLISLARSRLDAGAVLKFGVSLVVGGENVAGLDKIGEWLASLGPEEYRKYLIDTGQEDTIYGA
uniref:RNA-dependent RNA polymerase n=1 Tax=Erysiphe necator associated polymycovirus 8 TaxID=2742562 RepID=A0A8E4FPT4_9VIRU|nr:RNA-dependent RNA polymerase [Erysiphe necator associated polymycovirus 8]